MFSKFWNFGQLLLTFYAIYRPFKVWKWSKNIKNYLKIALFHIYEVLNVFPIMDYDVLDRLEHVWDIFDTVGSRKSNLHCQILPDFSAKLADFGVFKAFISNFLYYNLYQRKLKVITRPQCALRFFIRLLDFPLVSLQLSIRWWNFMSY